MPANEITTPGSEHYAPTMTGDYSRISDTARAIEQIALPGILAYLNSLKDRLADWPIQKPFLIADFGAADGVNSSHLFESIIRHLQTLNSSLRIKLVYIDIAEESLFGQFWANSSLSQIMNVETKYIQRSFYEAFPELTGRLNIGFSSTALHWLDTKSAPVDFFQHSEGLQPNQLSPSERRRFVDKWRRDWRVFLGERALEIESGGLLYLASLTDLGEGRWPAAAGYNSLRDISQELNQEGVISQNELNAIFIPDYFATPDEMTSLVEEENIRKLFTLTAFQSMSVPCAYFSRALPKLHDDLEKRQLAVSLARVVRAWSESSIKVGLGTEKTKLIDQVYNRLAEKFFDSPTGLPYQYCLLELVRNSQ